MSDYDYGAERSGIIRPTVVHIFFFENASVHISRHCQQILKHVVNQRQSEKKPGGGGRFGWGWKGSGEKTPHHLCGSFCLHEGACPRPLAVRSVKWATWTCRLGAPQTGVSHMGGDKQGWKQGTASVRHREGVRAIWRTGIWGADHQEAKSGRAFDIFSITNK